MMEKITTSTKTKKISEYTVSKEYDGLDVGFYKYIGPFSTGDYYQLHFICRKDFYHYFAYDVSNKKLILVREEFDDGSYTDYYMEEVSLEHFQSCVKECSERYYDKIKDITNETLDNLKYIQFGQNMLREDCFVKLKTNDGFILFCFCKYNSKTVPTKHGEVEVECFNVKLAEFATENYNKYFENCTCLEEVFDIFNNDDSLFWSDDRVKSVQKDVDYDEMLELYMKKTNEITYGIKYDFYIRNDFICEEVSEENLSNSMFIFLEYVYSFINGDGSSLRFPLSVSDADIIESKPLKGLCREEIEEAKKEYGKNSKRYSIAKKTLLVSILCFFLLFVGNNWVNPKIGMFVLWGTIISAIISGIAMKKFNK